MTTTSDMKNPMNQQQEANTLVLLSRSNSGHDKNQRMFECKTCNRQFPSFQALGGHRASHRKPRSAGHEEVQPPPEPAKPRIHECSICGLEFPLGQALGGHMRRHRTNGVLSASNVSKRVNMPGFNNLDLNRAPPESEAADTNKDWQQGIDLELQLDLTEKVRFVEWLH